ncbi:bifunctional DNA-formamidopyrimidine glycosylase/DNA-(apurinic or apyrimidinic site) lyase [candidate division KSB1 bacterium]|nr:bifunctional DNA-formamidopyrimidine glycosylase/DNA-(apurinic or apyrimidinic site) lyase [candidate division KSB1 bacterium]
MPELPEVETIVRQLRPHIVGKSINHVEIRRPQQWSVDPNVVNQSIRGAKIEGIRRNGKFIIISLDCLQCVIIHLRMTGKLTWVPGALTYGNYDRTIFHLHDGSFLIYNDTRALGRLEIIDQDLLPIRFEKYGTDPFCGKFSLDHLADLIQKSRLTAKDFLMNQNRVFGIGNIYANEILFHSNINPKRYTQTLTDEEIKRLYTNILEILSHAISLMGTTLGNHVSDYRNVYNMEGEYQSFLYVYGRQNEPCRICNNPIERIVQSGRSSFYCPVCQPFIDILKKE